MIFLPGYLIYCSGQVLAVTCNKWWRYFRHLHPGRGRGRAQISTLEMLDTDNNALLGGRDVDAYGPCYSIFDFSFKPGKDKRASRSCYLYLMEPI